MHFKGLLEAELLEPCSLGVRTVPDDAELDRVVSRAERVFLAAYGRGG